MINNNNHIHAFPSKSEFAYTNNYSVYENSIVVAVESRKSDYDTDNQNTKKSHESELIAMATGINCEHDIMFVVWTAAGERKFFGVLFRSAMKMEKRGFWGKWKWKVRVARNSSLWYKIRFKGIDFFRGGVLVTVDNRMEIPLDNESFLGRRIEQDFFFVISNHRWLRESNDESSFFELIFLEWLFLSFDWIYHNFVRALLENKQPTNLKWQLSMRKEKSSKNEVFAAFVMKRPVEISFSLKMTLVGGKMCVEIQKVSSYHRRFEVSKGAWWCAI